MKKLIIVADDYGLTNSVVKGTIKAYTQGIVSEISLMLNSPGSSLGIKLIKSKKIKNVGIHLLLKAWKDTGKIYRRQDYINLFRKKTVNQIRSLAQKELNTFEKTLGHKPTHICPQHGIHGNLKLLGIIIDYAKQFNIPVRIPMTILSGKYNNENYAAEIMLKRSKIKATDYLFGYGPESDLTSIKNDFLNKLKKIKDGKSVELFTHPGYFDQELLEITSLSFERARDLAFCLEKKFWQLVKKIDYKVINYSQL